MQTIPAKDITRFWSKVDKSNGCWAWLASLHPKTGYGLFYFAGKTHGAHRFAVAATSGAIPAGMQIDHTCHNRSCVNPEHLRVVTPKQNNENPAGAYASSKSGVRGVMWDKARCTWIAVVRHYGTRHYVGAFADIGEAERAVIAKRNELFTHNQLDRSA